MAGGRLIMRIGLYGGTFNPVHNGHVAAAHGAKKSMSLDKVIFIPSGHPPLKGNDGLAEGKHRAAMLDCALAGEHGMEVSTIEIDRDGPSFTVDTVRILRTRFPADSELFFLLGDDCVDRLPQWKGIDELHDILRFLIIPRFEENAAQHDDRLISLEMARVKISSTQIKALYSDGQRPDSALLPPVVADYIERNYLYAPQNETACA